MDENEIVQRIAGCYPDAVIDVAGEDCSFEVYVISEGFADMNTLKRQQSILALFKEELASGKLHALGVKAKTPQEQQSSQTAFVQIEM